MVAGALDHADIIERIVPRLALSGTCFPSDCSELSLNVLALDEVGNLDPATTCIAYRLYPHTPMGLSGCTWIGKGRPLNLRTSSGSY